jgi:hypothetical protein
MVAAINDRFIRSATSSTARRHGLIRKHASHKAAHPLESAQSGVVDLQGQQRKLVVLTQNGEVPGRKLHDDAVLQLRDRRTPRWSAEVDDDTGGSETDEPPNFGLYEGRRPSRIHRMRARGM